jgi:DNA polymerase-4
VYRKDLLRAWIRLLAEMVAARLRRYDLEGNTAHFYMRQEAALDWIAKQKNFSAYTANGNALYARCISILNTSGLTRYAVRALGISISGLRKAQKNYLFEEDEKIRDMIRAIDTVNDRFGEWTVYPAVLSLTRS